jgi:hypothetical protein
MVTTFKAHDRLDAVGRSLIRVCYDSEPFGSSITGTRLLGPHLLH